MKTFLTVLKNDYLRTVPRIAAPIVMTLVAMASVLLAVYMTNLQQVRGHVAYVAADTGAAAPKSTRQLDIRVLRQAPPHSDLVKQKYDAIVTAGADGEYQIETLRSDEFKAMVQLLMQNPDADVKTKNDRGAGVNIIGFMMMFVLLIAFSNLFAFAEDKEQGQLGRIALSPSSFGGYLAAHCVYCLSLLTPSFLVLVILKALGWKIGFSLPEYAGLMGVLGLLGISFALLLHTLIPKGDNADMLGNSVTILTSVLAGGFYSFTRKDTLLDKFIGLIPQKQVMDFAQYLQNGEALSHAGTVAYAVLVSLALFAVSCGILRRMYVKKA